MEVDHDAGNLINWIRHRLLLGGGVRAFTGHDYVASQVKIVSSSLMEVVVNWLFEIVLDVSHLADVSPCETGQKPWIKITCIYILIPLVWRETKSFLQVVGRDVSEFSCL